MEVFGRTSVFHERPKSNFVNVEATYPAVRRNTDGAR